LALGNLSISNTSVSILYLDFGVRQIHPISEGRDDEKEARNDKWEKVSGYWLAPVWREKKAGVVDRKAGVEKETAVEREESRRSGIKAGCRLSPEW
jgi:hypothetical protein